MVLGAPDALTKINFRRDIKFFLATLVGFLVVLILFLLLLLQNAVLETEITMAEHRETIADGLAAAVNRMGTRSPEELKTTLLILQKRFAVAALSMEAAGGRTISVGYSGPGLETLTRTTELGILKAGFDPSEIANLRRRFAWTAILTVIAVAAGTLMLLLYLPRITRPIEELLDEAGQVEKHDPNVDEQKYLIDTFRRTIATMRTQEEELRRLHDQQKNRADEFERVTAALTRSLTSGFIAADPVGRLVDVNASGREILRIPVDQDVVGRRLAEVLGPGGLAAVLQEAIDRRESLTRHEIEWTPPDGKPLEIGLSTVPLLNEQSELLGMLALFTDLTPVRELEKRVRQMQALADLGEMSAGIAHEFRNSLSTILGYVKLAQRQPTTDEMSAKLLKAEEEAALLSKAIESLLNFTRPMKVDRQLVDLRELVENTIARLESHASGIEFSIDGAAALTGDRTLLTRAIENILRNAIDSIHSKQVSGTIGITLREDPPSITIRDNGAGLSPEHAERLFLPFQSDRPGGFGLGLPLARKIVLLHDGSISLTGRPGEGAEVAIVFSAKADAIAGSGHTTPQAVLR